MFVLPTPTAPVPSTAGPTTHGSAGADPESDPEAFLTVLADALSAWVDDLADDIDGEAPDALALVDASEDTRADEAQADTAELLTVELFVPLPPNAGETPTVPGLPVETHTETGTATGIDGEGAAVELDTGRTAATPEVSADPDPASEGAPAAPSQAPEAAAGVEHVPAPEGGHPERDAEVDEVASAAGRRAPSTSESGPVRLVVDEPVFTTVARPSGVEPGPIGPTPDTAGPDPVQETTFAEALLDAEALDADDPWMQVARALRPLHQLADGSHRIALQLRPAELGAVHLEVTLDDGRLSVRALVESAATREVLAGALPELRDELTEAGIDLDSVDLGEASAEERHSGPGGEPALGERPEAAERTDAPGAGPRSSSADGPAPRSAAPGRLDLSL